MTALVWPQDESAPSTPDRMAQRHDEIAAWMKHFAEWCSANGLSVTFNPDVVDRINTDYWALLNESVRPRVVKDDGTPGRIDRHKIASLLELLIAHEMPFHHENEEIFRDINARFAFFVATNVIASWHEAAPDDLFISKSFDREHRAWLRQLNTHSEGWPIFSNAATWYLVELIYLSRHPTPP